MPLFTACSEDEGTDIGNDSQATVTLYSFAAEAPYDGDCDVVVRVAANSATSEAYALAETKEAKLNRVAELGADGYSDYVIENGEKLEDIKGASCQDKVFTGLMGDNVITVVAVNGSYKKAAEVNFTGINWVTVATGTYTFSVPNMQFIYAPAVATTLQYRADDPDTYRFKNLFGAGSHLIFTKTQYTYVDGSAVCRVPSQSTSLSYGSYGEIYVRDVATWQDNDAYLDCALYEDGSFHAWVQYYTQTANFGNGTDTFTPAE